MANEIEMNRQESVVVLTINNPPANSINWEVLSELEEALEIVEADNSVRVIVLTGAGDRMFSAGADIGLLNSAGEDRHKFLTKGLELFNRIELFPKPVIAAVNGFCLGGGCELALACDIRIASAKAKFGQPEISLGLSPGWGGMQRLTRTIGLTKALALLLEGGMLTSGDAFACGLVSEVVEDEQLIERSANLARLLASKAPLAMVEIKRRVVFGSEEVLHDAIRTDLEGMERLLGSMDAREGLAAFLEKRSPNFFGV